MFGFKIDDAAKYVALVSAGLYAIGFLVVNANLAKYGDFDPDFASSRYVFAGFLFSWYMLPFAYLVIKNMYDLKEMNEDIDLLKEYDKRNYYLLKLHLNVIDPLSRICLCGMLFGIVTLDSVHLTDYNNYAGLITLLSAITLLKVRADHSPRTGYVVILAAQIISISVFLRFSDAEIILASFSYIPTLITFGFAMKLIRQIGTSADARYSLLYDAMSLVTVVVLFGDQVYGRVKHEYGGGLPVKVTLYTKSDMGTSQLTKTLTGGFAVDMIALNDKKLIGISGGKLAIINADSIASVIYP